MNISPVQLSPDAAAKAIEQLTTRVTQLEAELRKERQFRRDDTSAVINTLRAHGVVLIHLGDGSTERLAGNIRLEAARNALDMAWNLDSAPLSDVVKSQIRAAASGGMTRW